VVRSSLLHGSHPFVDTSGQRVSNSITRSESMIANMAQGFIRDRRNIVFARICSQRRVCHIHQPAPGDSMRSLPHVAQSHVWGDPQLREAMRSMLEAVCIVFV
jgi:hypothetical protein